MVDSQSSYPTVKDWLKTLEWKKEVEERINPLTGEKDNLHHYILSIEVAASCSVSEEDEKKSPEILDHVRVRLEHSIEEHIDKLVLNKIKQQNRGGFHESIHAGAPIVVLHPKYISDIIKDGVFVKQFSYQGSPTRTKGVSV